MSLSGSDCEKLLKAMCHAYPNKGDLEQMVRFYLDQSLNAISRGQTTTEIIYSLINDWAEPQGKLQDLLNALSQDRPHNLELQKTVRELLEKDGTVQVTQEQPNLRNRLKIILNTDSYNHIFTVRLENITIQLQQLSGYSSLTIVGIERGSLILVLEGSQEGIERIEKLVKSAQLTEILGLSIRHIQRVPLDQKTIQEQAGITVSAYLDAQSQIQAILDEKLNIPQEERLFGIEENLEKSKDYLEDKNDSWFISVTGEGGIGKTSIVEKLVRENAALLGFKKLAWITAKRNYLNIKTGATQDTENILNVDSMIYDIATQLDIRLPLSTNDQFSYLQEKLRSASYLVIIDNLETLVEYQTLLSKFKGNHSRNNFRPSKVIFTSRVELQWQDINVTELKLRGLSQEASLELIKYQGKTIELIQNAHDEELLPIYKKTEGNPLLIKLVVNLIGRYDDPLPEILDYLSQQKSLLQYLYGEVLDYVISANAKKVLYSMPQFSPSSPVSKEMLKVASKLEDIELENAIEECVQHSLLARLPRNINQKSSYSIHNLLYEYLNGQTT